MTRLFSILIFLLVLPSCRFSEASQPMPPAYLVRLTSAGGSNLCTGFLVNTNKIILPAHCASFIYWVSNQYGQLSKISSVSVINSEIDIAVAYSENNLYFPFEDILGSVNISQPVMVYGQCNVFWPHTPRVGNYFGKTEKYTIWGVESCSGDSGAPIIQNGKVIGMLVKVAPDKLTLPGAFAFGEVIYAVDSKFIIDFLGE